MKIKKLFILIVLTLIGFGTYAQPKSFSRKPSQFISEYISYVSSEDKAASKQILAQFKTKWDSAQFVEVEQRNIINVANNMLINNLRIPSFILFTETMLFAKDSIDEAKYTSWSKALIPAIKGGNKTFISLLTASRNLFRDNIIYSSDSKKWYSSSNNYRFIFNNNRVQIAFRDIDLVGQAAVDNVKIYNTSGSYYLDTDEWIGTKGKVTWERVGFGKENIYAEIIGDYSLKFEVAELEVDTALFTNTDFLSNSLYGSLKDRVSSAGNITSEQLHKSKFPKFTSFRKNLELGYYLDDRVRFTGGFAMNGAEIIANGSASNPSTIEIYYKDKIRVKTRSQHFSLAENKIIARHAETEVYTDSGTIYHPNINFNLNLNHKLLIITRGNEGLEQAPFFNNDHEVEIYTDQIVWNLELPQIEFDMTGIDAKAIISSISFYKEERYERIPRGMLKYHPLSKMRKFVITHRKREFTFSEYTEWMGSKKIHLKPQIVELADLGYLYFNPDTDTIQIRKKLDHAVLSHLKLADYDVIQFSSVISARSNAFLNLINNTFVIEGVRSFRFSDSQSVYAFPHEQKIILKHKRRMSFGGKVTAGKFDFYSEKFDFDYSNFEISSDKIDEMVIFSKDNSGRNGLVAIKSVLRDINGTLEIDKPSNKSGLEDLPEYPRFTSNKGAIISYDKKEIHNGAYDKDRFRFEVDSFMIENLDNFTTEELSFPGLFVSDGIIPDFRYEAKIMDDYSLGFEKATETYPMYGGKGTGEIAIKLSEEGFKASGNLEYEGAKIASDDILMTPDYTLATAQTYNLNENAKYPNIFAQDVLTKWVPANDSLYINTNGHTVKVLRDDQEFMGDLVQTDKQISGNGVLSWEKNKLTSKGMDYKPNSVTAEVSAIEIGSITDDKIAFSASSMNSDIDFTTRIADFKQNEKGKLTEFLFNKYASTMDEYKWDMDAQKIEFNKGPQLAKENSYFVSIHPQQGGLKFESTEGLFDMKAGIIYGQQIPYIDVADSRVFPDQEKVEIHEDANMQTLVKTRILASRENKYHELFDGEIKINGRQELSGSASYVYKDKHNTGQIIRYGKVFIKGHGDSTLVARGAVSDSSGFTISPKIAFKGPTELKSTDEHIAFDGYVKPLHSLEQYPSAWFRYSQQPDPLDIIIPANEIKDEDQRKMYATVSVANDSIHIYPTMFNFKRSYADLELTSDTGIFFYDEDEKTFFVGDSMKLLEGADRGSYLSFNDATGEIYSEGKINFGLDKDENFNAKMAGNMRKMPNDSSFVIEALLALNMKLPEDALNRMAQVMIENESNDKAKHDNPLVKGAIAEFLGDKKLKKMSENMASTGELKPVDELDASILMSQMSLHFSPSKQQFISREPMHIATINGKQVNTIIDSRIAFSKRRSSTRYTFYFEVSNYDWFYIDYYLGGITVGSTDKEFNQIIKEQAPKLSKGKFRIRTASARNVALFLSKLDGE